MTTVRRRRLELACLALGVAVLAGTVWTIGIETLVRDLRTLGWGLAAILLVQSVDVLLNTGGWALVFPAGERPVGAARLVAVRLAGDAVNYLTPSATIGGELLRVRLLGRAGPVGRGGRRHDGGARALDPTGAPAGRRPPLGW